MMPVSTGAGRRVRWTFSPLCSPTPVARITFLMVRCCMGGAGSGLSPWGAENGERLARATLNLNESGAVRRHEPRGRKDQRAEWKSGVQGQRVAGRVEFGGRGNRKRTK